MCLRRSECHRFDSKSYQRIFRCPQCIPFPTDSNQKKDIKPRTYPYIHTYLAQAADKVGVHTGAGQRTRIHRAADVHARRREKRKFARNVRVVAVHIVHNGYQLCVSVCFFFGCVVNALLRAFVVDGWDMFFSMRQFVVVVDVSIVRWRGGVGRSMCRKHENEIKSITCVE